MFNVQCLLCVVSASSILGENRHVLVLVDCGCIIIVVLMDANCGKRVPWIF